MNHKLIQAFCTGGKIRCVGSALSPNGIAFSNEAMLSLILLDKVVSINPEAKQVTVQAGARVQEVVEALRPHGLTLQNYASIREQSIGGFTQVFPMEATSVIAHFNYPENLLPQNTVG